MKILFINIFQKNVARGAETFVTELAKRLKGEVDVISGEKTGARRWPFLWRFFIDPHGIEIALFTLKNLYKIATAKYDVIVPLNGGWQVRILRLLTWLQGSKLVISGQSGNGWDDRNNLWAFPDVFVALTKKSGKWAKKVNPFVKTLVIGNGVDLNLFKPSGNKYMSGLRRPVVLAVGAFTQQKRLDLTIEAVALNKDMSLLLAGAVGPEKNFLEEVGKIKLGDRFKIISVPYSEMPSVFRSADVFTLPSQSSEAFGNVYIEALATNLPVVATDDEQRREVVGEAGIFVNPENIKSYSDALKSAVAKKWGDLPLKTAEKYSWDKVAKKYNELFENLL